MAARDVEINFEPSEELIERVAKRGPKPKRNKRLHLMRTAQGKATYVGPKGHQRRPSMPTLPWDKKD